jgi:hypothetical protein
MEKIVKITPGWRSNVFPQYSITKLVTQKVEWILDHEVYSLPHIAWVSVSQIIWGEGMHWKEDDCPNHIKMGIMKHLKIYRASNNQRRIHKQRCRWEIPDLPEDLFSAIKSSVKSKIINPILKKENYKNINPLWARGYIDGDTVPPSFDDTKARDLVGWFFYFNDPDTYESQKRHLETFEGKNRNITCQFLYNSQVFDIQLRQQYAAISTKLELLEFCQTDEFSSHKLIRPKVSDEEQTWDNPEDEDNDED